MKLIILILLLAVLGVAVEYRLNTDGTSLVDRIRAKPVEMDMDSLNGRETQSGIAQSYSQLNFSCRPETNQLGDHVCWAPVSSFNGIDARIIAFFFTRDRLSAVRVSFSPERQSALSSTLEERYGPSRRFGQGTDKFGNNIVGWMRLSGFVVTNDQLSGDEDALLLWLPTDKVLESAFKR